jgi:DNA topoisomerase-1
MSSLLQTMTLERLTMDEAEQLLRLPRSLGQDPADGNEIVANNGRYGPYVVKAKDFRSIDSEDLLFTITLDEAARIFALPKVFKRGGRNMAAKGPLREFGNDPISERAVTAKDGRFGVYVTDGETNASIGKGDRIEEMTPERAFELLAIRRDAVAAKGGPAKKATRKKSAGKKKPAKKRAAATKPATKRAAEQPNT